MLCLLSVSECQWQLSRPRTPAAAAPRRARQRPARRGPDAWSEKRHCQRGCLPQASGAAPTPSTGARAARGSAPSRAPIIERPELPQATRHTMLGARYAVAAAPAPAPSRAKSPYIEVDTTKKPLLKTGAIVRLKSIYAADAGRGPFGICDAFDAKSNTWAVRFFGEAEERLVGEAGLVLLDDAEALDEATRARDRAAVRALIQRRPPPQRETRISREFDQEDFHCPVCRELLWKPVIKQCGHAACFLCTHKAMDQLCDSACPLCRAPFRHLGDVCEPLHNFICRTFRPEAVVEEEHFSCRTCGAPGSVYVGNCGHVLCEDCRDQDCACGARRGFTPRVPCALLELASHKARAPAGAPRQCLEAPAPERALSDESPYVHFGVGCDGCGAFPIRGAAFRCLDCPDAVGFALCAECRGSSLVVSGRFDQGHTLNHRVVEREQVRTWLHELQAANPQLGVHEVLDIARMQLQAAAPPPPDDSSSDDESFSRYGPGDPPRTA